MNDARRVPRQKKSTRASLHGKGVERDARPRDAPRRTPRHARIARPRDTRSRRSLVSWLSVPRGFHPHLSTDRARTRDCRGSRDAFLARPTLARSVARFLRTRFRLARGRRGAPAVTPNRSTGRARAGASGRDASRRGVSRRRRDPRGAEETRGARQRVRRFSRVRPTVGSGQVLLQQHRVLDRRAGGCGGGGGGGERGGDHVQVLRRHSELQVLLRRPRTRRAHRALRLRGIAGTKASRTRIARRDFARLVFPGKFFFTASSSLPRARRSATQADVFASPRDRDRHAP